MHLLTKRAALHAVTAAGNPARNEVIAALCFSGTFTFRVLALQHHPVSCLVWLSEETEHSTCRPVRVARWSLRTDLLRLFVGTSILLLTVAFLFLCPHTSAELEINCRRFNFNQFFVAGTFGAES